MPDSVKNLPRPIRIDRGPYSMKMEDGENAEITMYGEVVETHPTHWYTGEKLKGDFIAQDEFLQDLNSLAGAKSITIRMNSLGGDALVGMVIHMVENPTTLNSTSTSPTRSATRRVPSGCWSGSTSTKASGPMWRRSCSPSSCPPSPSALAAA